MSRLHALKVALSGRAAWAVTTLVAIFAVLLTIYVNGERVDLQRCLHEQAEATAVVFAARSEVAAQDRLLEARERQAQVDADEALDALLRAFADGRNGADEFQRLIEVRDEGRRVRAEVAEQRAALERERARNPVPDPPSEEC